MGKNIGKITPAAASMLLRLGAKLQKRRKAKGFSATDTATAAGISRATLNRIEKGESSVTAGAYMAVAKALGEEIALAEQYETLEPLDQIQLRDYPGFKQIAWHVGDAVTLTPQEVWDLLNRNERFLDWSVLGSLELHYLAALKHMFEEELNV